MDIIYKILKEIRFLLKNKKIKKLLLIFTIIYFILVITNNVLATDGSQGGGAGGGGFRGDVEDLVDYINGKVNSLANVDLTSTNTIAFYFYDEVNSCYRIVYSQTRSNYTNWLGLYDLNTTSNAPNNTYALKVWSRGNTFTLLSLYFDETIGIPLSYVTNGSGAGENTFFNDMFSLPNTLNAYNLLYAHSYATTDQSDKLNNAWSVFYKTEPVVPYVIYNGQSFNNNGYLSVNPGSLYFDSLGQANFLFEIYDDDNDTLEASYLLNTSSANFDSTNICYNFSLGTLDLLLNVGTNYSFKVTIYNTNNVYMTKEIMNVDWNSEHINGSIIINPDEPTTPDYSEDLSNINTGIGNINNGLDNINDFLTDDSVDDENFDLPSVEVNDPTVNFFDTLFTGLYNAINTNEEQSISFDLFNKTYTIRSSDFNFFSNNSAWQPIIVLFQSSWVFAIGYYILVDIRKMIEKIKDGNIENVATDDIKANMV